MKFDTYILKLSEQKNGILDNKYKIHKINNQNTIFYSRMYNFCTETANCIQATHPTSEKQVSPSTALNKYGKGQKHNMSNELTKSQNHEPKRKISIRHSISEKHKETKRPVDVSAIEKVEVMEDQSEIRYLLKKMK